MLHSRIVVALVLSIVAACAAGSTTAPAHSDATDLAGLAPGETLDVDLSVAGARYVVDAAAGPVDLDRISVRFPDDTTCALAGMYGLPDVLASSTIELSGPDEAGTATQELRNTGGTGYSCTPLVGCVCKGDADCNDLAEQCRGEMVCDDSGPLVMCLCTRRW